MLILDHNGDMGNALEAPITEKDTVRFERALPARKVSDLWIFACAALNLEPSCVSPNVAYSKTRTPCCFHVAVVQIINKAISRGPFIQSFCISGCRLTAEIYLLRALCIASECGSENLVPLPAT